MGEPVPEYVIYANDLVDKVGTRLEQTLKDAVSEMATKSDLKLIEERLENETKARLQLQAELKSDEDARGAKMRRLWGAFWGGLGTVVLASASIGAALIATHH